MTNYCLEASSTRRATRQLTREAIASKIRGQVLQSVHSISSCKDSESLILQQSELYVSDVAEPIHRVVSFNDIGIDGNGGSGGITGTEDFQCVVEERVELHAQSIFAEESFARPVLAREERDLPEESSEWQVLPTEEPALLEQNSAKLFFPTEEERSSQLVWPVEEERRRQLILPTEEEKGQLIVPVEEGKSCLFVILSDEEWNRLALPYEENGNQRRLLSDEDNNQLSLPTEKDSSRFSQVEDENGNGQLVSPAEQEGKSGQLCSPSKEESSSQVASTAEEQYSSQPERCGGSLEEAAEEGKEVKELCGICGEVEPHTCSGRIFFCSHCSKSFTSRCALSRHRLIHGGGKRSYRCNICGRSFNHANNLKVHQQIHKPTKRFKCDRAGCGKEYNSYKYYTKHCAFHSAEEGDLRCKFCCKMFDNNNELLYHTKMHVRTYREKETSKKEFQCKQCDRRFFTRVDVKRHQVVHTATRDFCCSCCPKKFGRKDSLVRHIKNIHGVADLTRFESLADPLDIPGSSGAQAASSSLSPGLSSVSISRGETTGLASYLLASSPSRQASLPPSKPSSSMNPGMSLPSKSNINTPSFSGFVSDPTNVKMQVSEPTIEYTDFTSSIPSLRPDLNSILGTYLPSSEGINMPCIVETSHNHSIANTHPFHLHDSPFMSPSLAYVGPLYQSLSSHNLPLPPALPLERGSEVE